jgi:hypothetical protein
MNPVCQRTHPPADRREPSGISLTFLIELVFDHAGLTRAPGRGSRRNCAELGAIKKAICPGRSRPTDHGRCDPVVLSNVQEDRGNAAQTTVTTSELRRWHTGRAVRAVTANFRSEPPRPPACLEMRPVRWLQTPIFALSYLP